MLRWTRTAIVLLLFFVAFGLSGLAIYESSAYQKCSTETGSYGSGTQQKKSSPHAFMPLINGSLIKFRCIGRSIDENDAVVTAVATVVIAVFTTILGLFTMSLAGSTRIAADAAKQSADAAEAAFNKLERPYIFITNAEKFSHDRERAPMGIASVVYEVTNHGKTPAIIDNVRVGISSGVEPATPIRVHDQHELFITRVVAPLYIYHPIEDAPDGIDFITTPSGEVVPQLKEGEDVFLWIIVSYCGAFTKGHETSACWRYDGLTNSLVQWGNDRYNYVR